MPFSIDRVMPWGRSLEEYRAMFSLSEDDLARRILGCGDGPASFNAELSVRGGSVVSRSIPSTASPLPPSSGACRKRSPP